MADIKMIQIKLKSLIIRSVPYFIRIIFDPEFYGIVKFMKFASKKIKPSDKVLDAGAGSCPYKKYFSHAKYESTDFEKIFDKTSKNMHSFICSLDNIPKPNNHYDAIINTQVLEHLENPQQVINEFYRVLKPKGKLFLTAPQGWGLHFEPYHFFNFTKYGLKSLFLKAGFKINFIKPRGGIFWYLGVRIKTLPFYIMKQYLFEQDNKHRLTFKPGLGAVLVFPFFLISLPVCCLLIPFLFFFLDFVDKQKDYSLGYACYCTKKTR